MSKSIATLAVVGLVTAAATSASAYHFENKGSFTATGSITVTAAAVSLPCTATLSGTVNGGTATITSAAFGGLSCQALTPSHLPWNVTISNKRNIIFHSVSVSAVVLGVCGPGNVPAFDTIFGKLTISGAGLPGLVPCSVSGTFRTMPELIVEK